MVKVPNGIETLPKISVTYDHFYSTQELMYTVSRKRTEMFFVIFS